MMALISEQLKYRKGGVTTSINLYSSTGDLGGATYLSLRVNGATVYAATGVTTHPNATDLRVRDGGSTLAVLSQPMIDLPSGTIGIFDASCPSGWTRFSALDGKFIQGALSYGGAGGGSHTHSVTIASGSTGSTAPPTLDYWTVPPRTPPYSVSQNQGDAHTHSFPQQIVTSGSGTNVPATVSVVFCKKD